MRFMATAPIPPQQQPLIAAIQSPTHIYGRSDANYLMGMIGLASAVLGLVLTWSSGNVYAPLISIFFVSAISGMVMVRASSFDRYFTVGIDAATLALLLPSTRPQILIPLWVVGTFMGRWFSHGDLRRAARTIIDITLSGCVFVLVLAVAFHLFSGETVSDAPIGTGVFLSADWVTSVLLAVSVYAGLRLGLSTARLRITRRIGVKEAMRAVGWTRSISLLAVTFAESTAGGMLAVRLVRSFPGTDAVTGQQAIITLVALCGTGVTGLVRTEAAWHRANALAHALAEPFEESTQPTVEAHIIRSVGQAMPAFRISIELVNQQSTAMPGQDAVLPRRSIEISNGLISPVLAAWYGQFRIHVRRGPFTRPFNRSDLATLDALAAILQEKLLTIEQVNQLSDQANTDVLTGLLNFRGLRRALLSLETGRSGASEKTAVIFMDLDNFKHVNDTFGHQTGDAVLREVGRRIASGIRTPDVAARTGGDEFIVVLHGIKEREEAERVADRLSEQLSEPITANGSEISISASAGVAIGQAASEAGESLLALADQRMYAAKSLHSAKRVQMRSQTGTDGKSSAHATYTSIDALGTDAIRRGIEQADMYVVYQPIVDAQTGQIVAVEGLIRPGASMPACGAEHLVQVARAFNLFEELTGFVFDTATADFAEFRKAAPYLRDLHLNIDAAQLVSGSFLDRYENWRTISPHIVLEVNERWMGPWDAAQTHQLQRVIAQRQLNLAIDDFGRTRVGFMALLDVPIDIVKIDKTVIDAANEPRTAALISGMVDMSHDMGIKLIFEGVATTEQLGFLTQCGARFIQGYVYSAPVSRSDFLNMLKSGTMHLQQHAAGSASS